MSDDLPEGMTLDELDQVKLAIREQLRTRMAALRRALTSELREERARVMCDALVAMPELETARVVAFYMPLRFEISPLAAMRLCRARNQTVVLPRVDPYSQAITLHRYEDGDELIESGFMVREPRDSAQCVAFDDVDVVLVPGLAFDPQGNRLGFGKGYYDRLLASLRAWRIGLCFDFQLLAEVPSFPHDVPMHALASDRRVLRCSK